MKYDIANRRRQRQSRTTPKNTVSVTPDWIPLHGIPEDVVEDGDDAPAPLVPMMPRDTGK
jgi:hypothetical protein